MGMGHILWQVPRALQDLAAINQESRRGSLEKINAADRFQDLNCKTGDRLGSEQMTTSPQVRKIELFAIEVEAVLVRQSPESKRLDYLRRLGITSSNAACSSNQRQDRHHHQQLEASKREEDSEHDQLGSRLNQQAMPKLVHDFRTSFLSKLSYQKVWVPRPQRPNQHSTLIVLDWDDTLLCTSYLHATKQLDTTCSPAVARRLFAVAQAAQALLALAVRLGETIIITNAANNWVEQSAKRYLPALLPMLEGVEIISARQRYEAQFPDEIYQWKAQTFVDIQRRRPNSITNFISIGDSSFEHDAALAVGRQFSQTVVKTIRFLGQPQPEELVQQLRVASGSLQKIVEIGRARQLTMAPTGSKSPLDNLGCLNDKAVQVR
eukprot:TRINITY_DN60787_c0_g1_i1.p1 TRINITY_DN60787_c0_g1~~TRINITY_DN60787_c0_g1_i1.p1  ORF type:complete len:395 (+),score=59.57 TRINITY_DN60787_c0_g1_i1:50-1186(+)